MGTKPQNSQLGFQLQPSQPYDLAYFVPHSGVAEAVAQFEFALEALQDNPTLFRNIHLVGPKGVGKRHLAQGYALKARALGVRAEVFDLSELSSLNEAGLLEGFVSEYEQVKSQGGLLLSFSQQHPKELTENPHLLSRLLAGLFLQLDFPREEELRPLLYSLSERHNLRLSERTMSYLERRIPLDPLSFADIFARVSRISFREGKPAGMSVVRQALELDIEAGAAKAQRSSATEQEKKTSVDITFGKGEHTTESV